jgi:hypothetical protein
MAHDAGRFFALHVRVLNINALFPVIQRANLINVHSIILLLCVPVFNQISGGGSGSPSMSLCQRSNHSIASWSRPRGMRR